MKKNSILARAGDFLRTHTLLSALGIAVISILLVWIFPLTSFLELKASDIRSNLRPQESVHPDILMVTIDDISFDRIGVRWPWPRQILARAITELADAGAKVIALDIMMGDAGYSEAEDAAFEASIIHAEAAGSLVVLASKREQRSSAGYVVDYFDMPLQRFEEPAAGVGYVNLLQDRDGFVRRVIPVDESTGERHVAFSAKMLMATGEIDNPYGLANSDGSMPINFTRPAAIPSVSFYRLLEDDFDSSMVSSKFVIIGAAFKESHDLYHTPVEQESGLYGMEIHANILNTAMSAANIRTLPSWVTSMASLILVLLVSISMIRLKAGASVWLSAGLVLGIITASFVVYAQSRFLIPMVEPSLMILLSYVGNLIFKYLVSEGDRRMVRSTFSRFVSSEVVDSLLDSGRELRLGGETREIVIFFSDICGFTSLSETMEPADIVEMLNEYFTAMTEIIFTHKGTVNKYIGDAIMAFYGAPLELEDPSAAAVEACIQMRQALAQMNEQRKRENKSEIKIGMGLHKGRVLVGNIGSPRQMEYTVIGDAVNVASRIEGLTRRFDTDLLISDEVYRDVAQSIDVESPGKTEVKGKSEKILVHKVLGRKRN